jgi:predicted  nucleic acid-binding Zn-ribbon protein
MTKSTLFDRLNQELEAFGKKAQAALDEGKLQIELLRLRRRQDNAARDLGLMVHRRERGGELEPRRIDALMQRLDDLKAEIARLELQISEARRRTRATSRNVPVGAEPRQPVDSEPPESQVRET